MAEKVEERSGRSMDSLRQEVSKEVTIDHPQTIDQICPIFLTAQILRPVSLSHKRIIKTIYTLTKTVSIIIR